MMNGRQECRLVAKPPIDSNSFSTFCPNRFERVDLYSNVDGRGGYRYQLRILDHASSRSDGAVHYGCAVFLIPQGREREYLFRTGNGLKSVAESARCARLIAVAFHRRSTYPCQESVQAELQSIVQTIAHHHHDARSPPGSSKDKIPFMALDGIGRRHVVVEGETATTGPFVVEEVVVNRRRLRRLYFDSNPFLVQTEVAMLPDADDVVDASYLAFDYHKHLAAGFIKISLLPNYYHYRSNETHSTTRKEVTTLEPALSSPPILRGMVIGLGGGGLVNFLHRLVPTMKLTAVELDEGIVSIAKLHFGFREDDLLEVLVGDGLHVCRKGGAATSTTNNDGPTTGAMEFESPRSMNLIAIDVDSKDATVGMSCPPLPFVDISYLTRLRDLLTDDGGVLAMNVSARDPSMLELVKRNVRSVFSSVFVSNNDTTSTEEDLNVVVFATKQSKQTILPEDTMELLNDCLRRQHINYCDNDNGWNVVHTELMHSLSDYMVDIAALNESTKATKKGETSGGKKEKGKKKKRGRK